MNENLNSSDNWFNQVEAEFVQESVLQKRQNISWRWRIAIAVILGLSGLTIWALIGQRNAQIGQIRASRQSSEANLRSSQELDALLESLRAGKSLKQLLLQLVKPDNEIQNQLKETLQKAVYQVKERNRFKGERDNVSSVSVSFSPRSQLLATAADNGTVRLWNLQGQMLKELKGNERKIISVSFSPDGQRLATAEEDGIARLWDLQGQLLKQLKGNDRKITSVSFSPNGQQLANVEEDGTARLWDLQTGEPSIKFYGKQSKITSVSFSPDGQRLATIEEYDKVHLRDLQGQHLAEERLGHPGGLNSVSFSRYSQLLAAAGNDGIVRVWNLQDQPLTKQLSVWQGTQGPIWNLKFSPDGQRLATAGDDGTVCLWDLQGQPLATWKVDQAQVWSISFSPNGKLLATAGSTGNAKLLQIESLDELMQRGCNWARDYLKNNPNVTESDRHLCDDLPKVVAKDKSF